MKWTIEKASSLYGIYEHNKTHNKGGKYFMDDVHYRDMEEADHE